MTDQIKDSEEELEHHSLLFRQIHRSQKWWQNIIDAITDYLFVIDRDYRILRTNKVFAGLFGKEPADIIMQPYYELYGLTSPHEWTRFPEDSAGVRPKSIEREMNGATYLISSYPIYFDEHDATVYIMKDITEIKRLKDQIYHNDRLKSIGTLAAGLAHEINNPLTGIIGYTEMLLMKNDDEATKKYLQKVYDAATRCKKIVADMSTFSRQNRAEKSFENINELIDKAIEFHELQLKSTNTEIKITRDYEDVPDISVDRQQIQQVILNLLINAEHAISETDMKGEIGFSTSYNEKAESVVAVVSDNGTGIPPDILPRIFDPFFTTKPVNKGTGLGLSITHGIVVEQGGTIEVESIMGKGTSFILNLPCS